MTRRSSIRCRSPSHRRAPDSLGALRSTYPVWMRPALRQILLVLALAACAAACESVFDVNLGAAGKPSKDPGEHVPGPRGTGLIECNAAAPLAEAPMLRLTRVQYEQSLTDLLTAFVGAER